MAKKKRAKYIFYFPILGGLIPISSQGITETEGKIAKKRKEKKKKTGKILRTMTNPEKRY